MVSPLGRLDATKRVRKGAFSLDPGKVVAARGKLLLSQEDLAQKTGVSKRTVERVEAGFPAHFVNLQSIAEALKTHVSELLPDKSECTAEHTVGSGAILIIEQEFSTYSDAQRHKLLAAIGLLLDVSGEIHVTRMEPRSIKLHLDLSTTQSARLMLAVNDGLLDSFSVVAILPGDQNCLQMNSTSQVFERILLEYLKRFCSSHTSESAITVGIGWKVAATADKTVTDHLKLFFEKDWDSFLSLMRRLATRGLIGLKQRKSSVDIWITEAGANALIGGQSAVLNDDANSIHRSHVFAPTETIEKRYFIIGTICCAFALGVLVWGFSLGQLTPDQRWIIRGLFSVASGFAAGAFTGRVTVRSNKGGILPGAAVVVTGGFAVWLLTHFLWKEPQLPRDEVSTTTKTLEGHLLEQGNWELPLGGVLLTSKDTKCTTNEDGFFKLDYQEANRVGHDVVLQAKKEGWVITHPDLKGRVRLPPSGQGVEVWMVKKGDKFVFTDKTMKRVVEDISNTSLTSPQLQDLKFDPDIAGALREFAKNNGFDEKQVLKQFEDWKKRAEQSKESYIQGMVEFTKKNYKQAEQLYLSGAVPHLEAAGDAAQARGDSDRAIVHYDSCLSSIDNLSDSERYQSIQIKKSYAQIVFSQYGSPKESDVSLRNAIDVLRIVSKHFQQQPEKKQIQLAVVQTYLGFGLRLLSERSHGLEVQKLLRESETTLRDALKVNTREDFPQQWATTQNNLGNTLQSSGEIIGGPVGLKLLQEAVAAYREALQVNTPEHFPLDWAMAQNSLWNALLSIRERTVSTEELEFLQETVQAYRKSLKVYTFEHVPQEWAKIQNNLGNALRSLGERTGGKDGLKFLKEAVESHEATLKVCTFERVPQDWAKVQNNLGNALRSLGERTGGKDGLEILKTAIEKFHKALKVYTIQHLPQQWAMTQNNLGQTLWFLGQKTVGKEGVNFLREAVEGCQNTLKVYTLELFPQQWADSQNNLGIALMSLGNRLRNQDGEILLMKAVEACQNALPIRSLEHLPLEWAKSHQVLGHALRSLGERTANQQGLNLLKKAIESYQNSLKVFTFKVTPQHWADTHNDLGVANALLGERTIGPEGQKFLQVAIEEFHFALQARSFEYFPWQWAATQDNLGNAHRSLGERTARGEAINFLKKAVEEYNNALRIRTIEHLPLEWSTTQNNLGNVLWSLGERTDIPLGLTFLKEAIEAYGHALEVRTREHYPLDWAKIQNHLGNVLFSLGERTKDASGFKFIKDAIEAYKNALQIRTLEQFPLDWAMTQNNVGLGLRLLGERTEREMGIEFLRDAVRAHQDALNVFNFVNTPTDWAKTQNNLGNALWSLGERIEDEDGVKLLRDAVLAYREAQKVLTKNAFPYHWEIVQKNLEKVEMILKSRENK